MKYDLTGAIQKLVPISRVYGQAPNGDQPIAYLLNRRYTLVAGSDIVDNLRAAGERFVTITEIPAAVRPEAQDAFCSMKQAMPLVHEALVSYQPLMVEGANQIRRWTGAEVRLDYITKALAQICFPFEGLSLLDLGCVIGFMSISLDSYGFDVTAIDREEQAVSIARAYNEIALGDVDFQVGEVREFVSNCTFTYDVILLINVLHWLWTQREEVPLVVDFIQRLSIITRHALVIATPLDRTSGLADLKEIEEDGTDVLRRWCAGAFSTVELLAGGPRHPMWVCKKAM